MSKYGCTRFDRTCITAITTWLANCQFTSSGYTGKPIVVTHKIIIKGYSLCGNHLYWRFSDCKWIFVHNFKILSLLMYRFM